VAKCWLKGFATAPTPFTGVFSGIRKGFEVNIDRGGRDFATFDQADPRPEVCQRRCRESSQCASWTLAIKPSNGVRDGSGNALNRCFLKSAVPSRTFMNGVVSGLKGGAFL
jgi:hypothetical protein